MNKLLPGLGKADAWRLIPLFLLFGTCAFLELDSPSSPGLLHYLVLALSLGLAFAELFLIVELGPGSRRGFWFSAWILSALRIALLATGGEESLLQPLAYLTFPVLAGFTGWLGGAALLFLFAGSRILPELWQGRPDWLELLLEPGFLAGGGIFFGLILHWERKARKRAESALRAFTRDMAEFQRDDTRYRLSGLTDEGRKREALQGVLALDQAFDQVLLTARRILDADLAALYWSSSEEPGFHLRACSPGEKISEWPSFISEKEPWVSVLQEKKRPLRLSKKPFSPEDRILSRASSGRGPRRGQSLVAAVGGQAGMEGILIAQRNRAEPFGLEHEKLISLAAELAAHAHEEALRMKRAGSEAAKFRSLAELARRLSRTLDLEEILASVVRMGMLITDADACAVLLPDEEKGLVFAAGAGLPENLEPGTPAAQEKSLATAALNQNGPLLIQDLKERRERTPALSKKLDPPNMRSLLFHTLPLRGREKGMLAFFRKEPRAFGRYLVGISGLLADLAAVSIQNALLYRETERMAVTDGLTGLYNHRRFQEKLEEELERAERLGNRVALVICDLDHFKKINDTHGHPTGDQVLKAVAGLLRDSIRKVDTAARYGGEEFALILVAADLKGAAELAERVRARVRRLVFQGPAGEFKVSLSMGIAVYPDHARTKSELIAVADQALYRAKQEGRNRVVAPGGQENRAELLKSGSRRRTA